MKNYDPLKLEIVEFDVEDVITESAGGDEGAENCDDDM